MENLNRIRNEIKLLEYKKQRIEAVSRRIDNKIDFIRDNCSHELVVKTMSYKNMYGVALHEAHCLVCDKKFFGTNYFNDDFEKRFSNLIYYDTEEKSTSEKIDECLYNYNEIIRQNPNVTNEEICEKINNKIKQKMI